MTTIETGGLLLAPAILQRKRAPLKIRDALERISDLVQLRHMYRPTLSALCRYVDKVDPTLPVYVKRDTILRRFGLTPKTVYNHFRKFEQLGLVTVHTQKRNLDGTYGVTEICLTSKLAEMLGWSALTADTANKSENKAASSIVASQPSVKSAVGIYKGLPELSVSKKQGRQQTRSVPTVPADLTPLVEEHGMLPQAVCKMMSTAKANGHLLSDIYAAVRKRLSELQLQGGRAKRYLEKVCKTQGTDFAAVSRMQQERAQQLRQAEIDKAAVAAFQAQWKGRVLSSADGSERLVIAEHGRHAEHVKSGIQGTLMLQSRREIDYVLSRIADGRLREGEGGVPAAVQPKRSKAVVDALSAMRSVVGLRSKAGGAG